jgi:hypothetical protein
MTTMQRFWAWLLDRVAPMCEAEPSAWDHWDGRS